MKASTGTATGWQSPSGTSTPGTHEHPFPSPRMQMGEHLAAGRLVKIALSDANTGTGAQPSCREVSIWGFVFLIIFFFLMLICLLYFALLLLARLCRCRAVAMSPCHQGKATFCSGVLSLARSKLPLKASVLAEAGLCSGLGLAGIPGHPGRCPWGVSKMQPRHLCNSFLLPAAGLGRGATGWEGNLWSGRLQPC